MDHQVLSACALAFALSACGGGSDEPVQQTTPGGSNQAVVNDPGATSPPVVTAPEPIPGECIDTPPVNDGFGWNGVESCTLAVVTAPPLLPAPVPGECVDMLPLNDGFGWNGVEVCTVAIAPGNEADIPDYLQNLAWESPSWASADFAGVSLDCDLYDDVAPGDPVLTDGRYHYEFAADGSYSMTGVNHLGTTISDTGTWAVDPASRLILDGSASQPLNTDFTMRRASGYVFGAWGGDDYPLDCQVVYPPWDALTAPPIRSAGIWSVEDFSGRIFRCDEVEWRCPPWNSQCGESGLTYFSDADQSWVYFGFSPTIMQFMGANPRPVETISSGDVWHISDGFLIAGGASHFWNDRVMKVAGGFVAALDDNASIVHYCTGDM